MHNLPSVQGPVLGGPGPESAASSRQAQPDGEKRPGLRSGVIHGNNIPVTGGTADGSRVQKERDSCELVLRAASEMENSGCLRDLRSSVPVSAPEQSNDEPAPGAVVAQPGQPASQGQGSGAGGGAPVHGGLRQQRSQYRSETGLSLLKGNGPVQAGVPVESGSGAGGTPGLGGHTRLGSQDRSNTGLSLLEGNFPVQAAWVPVERGQGPDLAAGVQLPTVRRGSRVKTVVKPYQAGTSGMG